MALPPQALEQLSREPVRTPGWSGTLLMFSSTLLFVGIFAWVGLSYGYQPYLSKQLDGLDAELKTASKQINADTQSELISFYSQLTNLDTILDHHVYASAVFDLLEARVQPNIFFTKLDLNTETGKMILGGSAKSVKDVTEQVKLLEDDPKIASVALGNVAVQSNGSWQFDMTVNFKDGVLSESPDVSSASLTTASGTLTAAPAATTTASSTAGTKPSTSKLP